MPWDEMLTQQNDYCSALFRQNTSHVCFLSDFLLALNCGKEIGILEAVLEALDVSKEFDLGVSNFGKDLGILDTFDVSTEYDRGISVGAFDAMDDLEESTEFLSLESSVVSRPSLNAACSTAS